MAMPRLWVDFPLAAANIRVDSSRNSAAGGAGWYFFLVISTASILLSYSPLTAAAAAAAGLPDGAADALASLAGSYGEAIHGKAAQLDTNSSSSV